MATVSEIRLRVEMDAEKVKRLEVATQRFKDAARELEVATNEIRNAMYDMQDALTVSRGDT